MKTFYLFKRSFIALTLFVVIGCGAETLAAIIFIPAFAATWPVVGNDEYRLDLQPDADNKGVESGVFAGVEEHDSDATKRDSLFGSFNGLNIEFTIRRPAGGVQYTGTMTPASDTDHTIVKIVLNSSSEGRLVLAP